MPRGVSRFAAILCFLLAAACGGDADPDPDPGATADVTTVADTRRDGPALALGEVASFNATVSGAKDTTYEGSSAAGDIEAFGGCSASSPLRLGFNLADGDSTYLARFRADTKQLLEPGETGTFDVESASFWYRRTGLPSRTTFEGTGTLEITHHEARRGARRMHGRLVAGGLEDGHGDVVSIEAQFELGVSCGIE